MAGVEGSDSAGEAPALPPPVRHCYSCGLGPVCFVDPFRRAAEYVSRILRGAKPGDLPVQELTKFELVINLSAAKGLGLAMPRGQRQLNINLAVWGVGGVRVSTYI